MTPRTRVDTLARLPRSPTLRIALVVERFAPGAGGVENVAWQVAHELVGQGEDVTIAAREADPASAVPVRILEGVSRRGPGRTLAFSRAAARATRPPAFDVVHSFSRTRHQDLFRAGGGSHADYLRRTAPPAGAALRRLLPRHRSLLAVERRVFADPRQRIQCASRLVADRLCDAEGVDRGRILLLPNAVDAARFDAAPRAGAARALRASLEPRAGRVWLFAGSGWRRKGLATAIEALARSADPELRLWVAGRDDPARWRRRIARAGVGGRIRFLGPRRDLELVYAAADGLLLPTFYDAFANVTFEAAAAGLPIVTTRANGAAEWLPEEACRRVEPGDAEALARALDALADTDRRRCMGAAARAAVRPYDWPGHVRALRAEYAGIVAARAAVRPDGAAATAPAAESVR